MPRIILRDAWGQGYHIDTKNLETIKRWFSETLVKISSNESDLVPTIHVYPLQYNRDDEPDWLTDSRVLGEYHVFYAKTGEEAMIEMLTLKINLTKKLVKIKQDRGH